MTYGWRGGGFRRGGAGFSLRGDVGLSPLPPPAPGHVRIAISTSSGEGLKSVIAPRFARAPFITVVDAAQNKVVDVKVFPNPFSQVPRGAGMGLGQWLLNSNVTIVVAPHLGPNISILLQQAGVRVELAPPGTPVSLALQNLGFTA